MAIVTKHTGPIERHALESPCTHKVVRAILDLLDGKDPLDSQHNVDLVGRILAERWERLTGGSQVINRKTGGN